MNAVSIIYIYIYIKCGDVSDACARLQKCEDEEEILFRNQIRRRLRADEEEEEEEERLRQIFFCLFFVPNGSLSVNIQKYRSISSLR